VARLQLDKKAAYETGFVENRKPHIADGFALRLNIDARGLAVAVPGHLDVLNFRRSLKGDRTGMHDQGGELLCLAHPNVDRRLQVAVALHLEAELQRSFMSLPNIRFVIDIGETPDGRCWQFVRGRWTVRNGRTGCTGGILPAI